MSRHLRANLWLLFFTIVSCSILYPAFLLAVGQTLFRNQTEGSLIRNGQGTVIGSQLVAQPFNDEQYFQPRPSAASYNGAATAGSNWGANNYLLRDRVARTLGPVVKYRSGPKAGQLVAPDIEAWFQQDHFQGQSGIIAQWASAHPTLAANWVKADPLHSAYVAAWQTSHAPDVTQWSKDNPVISEPKPEDLAVIFFTSFSQEHPGTFPVGVISEGSTEKKIEPVATGNDIQSLFFDMWRHDHPDADLEPVPADMVLASGSGLDPHITLANARYQLDRVAAKRAAETQRSVEEIRAEIDELLTRQSFAPLGGLAGPKLINVLEVNLALNERYSSLSPETSETRSKP